MESTMLGLFVDHYQDFARRLRMRLRSDDMVDDVMQETFLRVEGMRAVEGGSTNPTGYLFRMALNVAADQRRADSRFLTGQEVDELLHMADDALDPAHVFQARRDIAALQEALAELTARQRDILIAARVEEQPHTDIAARFGISVRMVGKDLRKALEHCGDRLDRRVVQRFGPGAGKTS
ncbi:RNA polymerase sigma-70 factor (ECF subfamily) [Luteibacter rhizovicinus]|uniref:RNA polymerase sigma-70 factor (ECF subfamily) n=1 Tax=Luteibacter rhizovicinus TaxID=242606 RepID=A0A4R3YIB8_9GAMM|nr:RNA polymerase sigma factor [Luteibacter rhizovicinus]TCV91782.1 RNA polymerase sigma-70 factor (ECF subfamily) [Luteibacter rhizovicinus]